MTRVLLAISLLTVCVSAQSAADDPASATRDDAIEAAVLRVNDAMVQAANRLDVDGFFAHVADVDAVRIIQNGVLFETRQEAYEAVRQGFRGIARLDRSFEQTHVTVVSPDCAVLTGTGTAAATLEDGRVLTSGFAASVVFVLSDGEWKLLQGHYSTSGSQ